jgi:hypothetical protein
MSLKPEYLNSIINNYHTILIIIIQYKEILFLITQSHQPLRHMTKGLWSGGLFYDKQKTEALMSGENQHWYSLKNAMIEHVGCSSMLSAGQEHYKAKQHILAEMKKKKRITDINTNLVGAAIQVCKMKAAGMSYERMIGFLLSCGADVGNIGHGR